MKYLLVCLTCLLVGRVNGQSCCATTGASSVAIGASSGSILLEKGQFAIQSSGFTWKFQPLQQVLVVNDPIADVGPVTIWSNSIAFGLSDNWSLQYQQPYFWLNTTFHGYNADGKRMVSNGNIHGFSDGILLGKTQLKMVEKFGLQVGVILGMELPNGKTEVNTVGIVNSLGSKSWDPLFGLNLYRKSSKWVFGLESQYKWTTSNLDGIDQGDLASSNGFLTRNWAIGEHQQISLSTGIKGIWADKQRENEIINVNSGGLRTFFSTGIVIQKTKTYRWTLEGNWPTFEQLNGQQNRSDFFASMSITLLINSKNTLK